MKKVSLTVLVSLSVLAGAAYAQDEGVMESTDPGKAAEVEQHAQELQQQQEMQPQHTMPMHKKPMHHHKMEKKDQSGG
jgi:hypothetical protein